ncbi:MAG: sensor histidine kinase [Polyangiaceae bacterium]
MKRAMNDEAGQPITLGRYLGSRLMPLAALVLVAVSLSAPVAFLALRLRELHAAADHTAHAVADLIAQEAEQRPHVWRYDTPKLVEHVARQKPADVERIEIADPSGRPMGFGSGTDLAELRGTDVLWESVALQIGGEHVGDVWVAVSTSRARRDGLLLLVPFTLIGFVLAALVYGIPIGAAGRAERRIGALVAELDRSRAALANRGEDLEKEVRARSSELTLANAELKRKEARLRELSSRTAALEEDERRAIARELHDSAGQALTAIRIHLQILRDAQEKEPMKKLAGQTVAMTDETLEEIRRAVRMLGPAILDEIGLARALEQYCDDFAERSRVEVTRTIDFSDVPLSAAIESACYRIAQEALTNVAKHADARHVDLRVTVEDAALVIEISDDGRGFLPTDRGDGRGLTGMRERTELLGGAFHVTSKPGEGTTLRADLPIAPPSSRADGGADRR